MSLLRRSLFALFLLSVTMPLVAITYIVPPDRELVTRAEAIAVATALRAHPELRDDDRIVTVSELRIEQVLKGALREGDPLSVVLPGGVLSLRASVIPGMPRFRDGKRYLLFLTRNNFGEWISWGWGLGRFEFVKDLDGRELLTRGDEVFGFDEGASRFHIEKMRIAPDFVRYVQTVVESPTVLARDEYFVEGPEILADDSFRLRAASHFVPEVDATRADYLDQQFGAIFRWQNGGKYSMSYCCPPNFQPNLNGPSAASTGASNWTNAGTSVNLSIAGANSSATGGLITPDGINGILFNDPQNFIPSGIAGAGGFSASGGTYQTSPSDGFTYTNPTEVDVVIAKNPTGDAATFNGILTHEIGHTLGFRHADRQPTNNSAACTAPLPCSSTAIMTSTVPFGLQTLTSWDSDAIQTVYGSGPTCTAPSITTQPSGATITSGQSATLSVAASGTAPLSYQWFTGTPPGSAIAGATSSSLTVTPATTTTYFVNVSNSCGSVNSSTATVTVNPSQCPTVTVTVGTPVQSGSNFILTASASGGSGFTFQWFQGTPPSGTFVGSGNPITVSPSQTTTYFVRATNSCGNSGDSAAVTVTITACPTVTVTVGTPVQSGSNFILTASASGGSGFTFQWFQGTPPSGTFVGSGNPITVSPSQTTTYFVRATNSCGNSADSAAVTVTVTPTSCPAVTVGAPTVTQSGSSFILTASPSGGSGFTFSWFRVTSSGNVLEGSTNPLTVTPTTATTYFVTVTNSCGNSATSPQVTVTPGSTCTPPSLTQPANQTIIMNLPTTITVVATGTATLHYQWFRGAKDDTSKPVGTDSATLKTGALSSTTQFWVRVTNSCGEAKSATITITTQVGRRRPSKR